MFRRVGIAVGLGLCAILATPGTALAFSNNEIHIAVVTDIGGSFSDVAGTGATVAADLAIEDVGGRIGRTPIHLSTVDHRNDPTIAAEAVRTLHAQRPISVIAELGGTDVSLPLQTLADELGIAALHSGSLTSALTGEACSPNAVHWGYDTYSLGSVISSQIFSNSWHLWTILTPEGDVGDGFRDDLTRRIHASGGFVTDVVRYPFGALDLTEALIAAENGEGEAIAVATAGEDLTNMLRQMYERGLNRSDKGVAIINMSVHDVQALGLYVTTGLEFTVPFYWDHDDQTRAFAQRFWNRAGTFPSAVHAAVYSSVRSYLQAADAVRTDNPERVIGRMRETPVNDFFGRGGEIRPDGRLMHPKYRVRVKTARESQGIGDYLDVIEEIPADAAFPPLSQSACPLLG